MKFYIYILALTAIVCSGCSKWLDVKPEDKFIENQLYSTPGGFEEVMNGFYIVNGTESMYGGRLTMLTMDVLAQLYNVSTQNGQYIMSSYRYTDAKGLEVIDGIWSNFYSSITGLNKFLASIDTYGSVLSDKQKDLYRGEAIGLRAFYSFEVARLFAPAYGKDSTSSLLPYYTKADANISPYYPTNQVMQMILDDLTTAEGLLEKSDAALGQLQVSAPTQGRSRTTRNYHMNYYAVLALKARVLLWMRDKPAALIAAKRLLDVQSKFPWTEVADLSLPDISNKVFSTEMIFGVENPKLTNVFNDWFSPALFDENILAGNTSGTFINTTIFESQLTDYRYLYNWKLAGKSYPTFYKYQETSASAFAFARTVPLIKMSEMHLIAAECEPDLTTALAYLNNLRNKRNRTSLAATTTTTQLTTAIMKEYRREFYGEGQLFFYYKRTQAATIVAAGTNANLSMKDANYTFNKPLSETTPR